jgi:HPt (histidine-containing phosphotransfer) domain-containing protein
MARQQPIELFMPPNMLKAKAGGGLGGLDMAAMKRAEAAMETLKSEFSDWMAHDVDVLMEARTAYARAPGAEGRAALMRAAHDLKGNAPTFDFPLIARVAGSLSRLIGELPENQRVPANLVDAHVNAVLVIHKQNIRTTEDKMAQTLCAELDARVDETLDAAVKS